MRKDVMLCYPFSRNRLEKWEYYYVQPKFNGLRCRAVMQKSGKVKLFSSEGNVIESVPHLNPLIESLFETLPNVVTALDGELYKHGMPLQDIRGIVGRTQNIHAEHAVIDYVVFDHISDDAQTQRLADIWALPLQGKVRRAPEYYCKGDSAFEPHLQEFMSKGYEGAVLRKVDGLYEVCGSTQKRSLDLMKIKPRSEDNYVIVGLSQEEDIYGQPKNSLGSFTVMDSDGECFSVGSGPVLTRSNRIKYWKHPERVKGKVLRVRYPELTNRGVPRSPVAMEVIEP